MLGIVPTLNSTFITLIPKGNNADGPRNVLPISQCNII